MAEIIGLTELRRQLGRFEFREYRELLTLVFRQESDRQDVELLMTTERPGGRRLRLICRRVTGLRLKAIGGGARVQIAGFDVEDVSDRGWDGINWHIVDFENDVIGFYAMDVAVELVDELHE